MGLDTRRDWSSFHTVGDRQKVVAGFELRNNVQQDQQNLDVEPHVDYLDSQRSSRNWALFAQDEVRIGERFLVNVGVRHASGLRLPRALGL